MAVSVTHGALPFPVKNARYSLDLTFLDADGDPVDPTALDSEFSLDNGAFTDCAEEVTLAANARGGGTLTLTGAETNGSLLKLWIGCATAKAPMVTLAPRVLPIIGAGTAAAGAAGTLTLPAALIRPAGYWDGIIIRTTGGTGGGGAGGLANQARVVTASTAAGVLSVVPNWETTPDGTTTFDLCGSELWIGPASLAGLATGIVYGPVTAAGGSVTSLTFPANSFSENDTRLVGGYAIALGGTGQGQHGRITAFAAATEVATLDITNGTAFDSTTIFIVLAGDVGLTAAAIAAAVSTLGVTNSGIAVFHS